MHSAKFEDAPTARTFMLAGNARVTLVSSKTGTRFTFRIATEEGKPHFVAVLTGSNNDTDYTFVGTIFEDKAYVHGRRSRINPEAACTKAFAWAWKYLAAGRMPPGCEVFHEGRCGRCARTLTTPESLTRGLGPECAQRAA